MPFQFFFLFDQDAYLTYSIHTISPYITVNFDKKLNGVQVA